MTKGKTMTTASVRASARKGDNAPTLTTVKETPAVTTAKTEPKTSEKVRASIKRSQDAKAYAVNSLIEAHKDEFNALWDEGRTKFGISDARQRAAAKRKDALVESLRGMSEDERKALLAGI